MKKTLFLLDLDLTLIDHSYKPTVASQEVAAVARTLLDRGHVIGLISDSPTEVLQQWMRTFGFRGPIIAERGACVVCESGRCVPTAAQRVDWVKLRVALGLEAEALERNTYVQDQLYLEAFASLPKVRAGRAVVLFNPYRRYSWSAHVRRVGNARTWEMDDRLFLTFVSGVRKGLSHLGYTWLDVDANADYGVCIIADPEVQKAKSIPHLRSLYPGYEVIAIGDGVTDLTLHGVVDQLWAVGNATSAFRELADRVATKHITAGVLELLQTV